MTVVLTVGCCQVELTGRGFLVTRDGEPVPCQVHPPALLMFASKSDARAYAAAIDAGDHAVAHRLIGERGRWWS